MKYHNITCPVCLSKFDSLEICYEKLDDKYDLLECENCGHGFIMPLPSSQELTEFYSNNYKGRCKNNINENLDFKTFVKLYTANIHDCKRRIKFALNKANIKTEDLKYGLDLGCSYGTGVIALDNFVKKAYGIDIDEEAVSYAKQRLGDKISLKKINLITSETYDIITHFNVLEHVRDPIKELIEISRCLVSDKGVYICKIPNFGSIWSKFFKEKWYNIRPPEHLNYFTHKSITIAFKQAGLKTVFVGTTWGEATPSIITLAVRARITSIINKIKKKLYKKNPLISSFLIKNLIILFKFLTILKRLIYRVVDAFIITLNLQGNTIIAVGIKIKKF